MPAHPDDAVGALGLLVHCDLLEASLVAGERRRRRQQIHRAVLGKLVQRARWVIGARPLVAVHQEPVVGARQADEPAETHCGETAGPAGCQGVRVGVQHGTRQQVVVHPA